MNYVLGIDGGGSKTVCVLMNEARQILGRGEAGASNYQSVGTEAALKEIISAIELATKKYHQIRITGACLGLAGVGRSKDTQVIKDIIQQIQNSPNLSINWQLKAENLIICHDALIALVGGIGHHVGIVVAAGTGSIVFGRNQQGKTKRVGGWGYILGDEGSAYKIAVAGMQAALKAYDGRDKTTSLIEDFQANLKLENIEDLIEVIYRRKLGVKEIAALAPIVDLAAASGDEVANQIIDDAVEELVKATISVIQEIFSFDSVIEVVTTGNVWGSRCKIQERFTASLLKYCSLVKVISPRYEPAFGAGLLALDGL
ncbi:MAG TPA: BadF/BadG/BcrA/BcrD ATPase family protein [Nostocaceae cyanobacterium]|nr:BadF/BadG/BcrA/BcrD ATPase family protein [Nostocaceae cyanobacterium]